MPKSSGLIVRDAQSNDFVYIQTIYANEVLNGIASFEELPPSVEDLLQRQATVLNHGLPYLVADLNGQIAGFCYATPYRSRPAYRYTIENSIYVSAQYQQQGIGHALLNALIVTCEQGHYRQMVAVISKSDSEASLALHKSHGFRSVGVLIGAGFKHGQWVDTVFMQRELNGGTTSLPV